MKAFLFPNKRFTAFLAMLIGFMSFGATLEVSAQTTNHVDSLNIYVTDPGTLGDLILAQTENFSDLRVLVVSGELVNDDFDNILRCTNLRKIDMAGLRNTTLPSGLYYSYNKTNNIQEVVFPDELTAIPDRIFTYCKRLKRVIIPPHVKTVGQYAFSYCDSIEYVECGQELESIGSYAFLSGKRLTQVVLNEGLKRIEHQGFSYCDLREVHVPSTVTYLSSSVFSGNSNLTTVTLPEGLTEMGSSCFEECSSLTEIDIPSTVEVIGSSIFEDCTALTTVHLHEGLKKIGDYAFYRCSSLQDISLPITLLELGSRIFDYCSMPSKFDIYCVSPPRYSSSSKPFPCDTIRVPYFSTVDYKQRNGWDQFVILPLPDLPDKIYICENSMRLNLPELPANYKPSMTIESWRKEKYPTVEVNGSQTLSLSDFKQSQYNYLYSSYYGTLGFRNSSLLTNTTMRADRVSITFQTSATDYRFWNFFTLPFNVRMQDIVMTPIADLPNAFFIYEYSGENRALGDQGNTWQRVPDDGLLVAGKGYILNTNCDLTFKARDDSEKNNIFRINDVEVELEEHLAEFAHNRSWNLIGNPFPCWYDTRLMEFDAPFVVWQDGSYATYTPYDDSYVLRPGQAFFVQRPVDSSTLGFPAEGRQNTADVIDRGSSANSHFLLPSNRRVYNLTLTSGDFNDRTRICVNPQTTMDYDMGRDATKFMSLDSDAPQIYTLYHGVRYSINERPEGDGKVTLGLKLPHLGTYTIALGTTAYQPITLMDQTTGKNTLMTDGASYTFDAEMGDNDGRFIIALGDYTDITEMDGNGRQKTGTIYDLQGRRMNTTNLNKGIYVVDGRKVVVGQ